MRSTAVAGVAHTMCIGTKLNYWRDKTDIYKVGKDTELSENNLHLYKQISLGNKSTNNLWYKQDKYHNNVHTF